MKIDTPSRTVHNIRPPKPKWRRIGEERVRLVFGKRCACTGVPDKIFLNPLSLEPDGFPICRECGDDYEYERTMIK